MLEAKPKSKKATTLLEGITSLTFSFSADKYTADKFQLSVLCKGSVNCEHKVIFLTEKATRNIKQNMQVQSGTEKHQNYVENSRTEAPNSHLEICMEFTDLTRKVKRSMFSLLVLDSMILGSSKL